MKTICFIFFTLFFTQQLIAQHTELSGLVQQGHGLQAIAFVTVSLNDTTGKRIATAITNEKGIYNLGVVPAGQFAVSYSYTGFQTVKKLLVVHSGMLGTLPTVILQPDPKELNEVTVSAERRAVSLQLEKKVFEVGRDVLSQSGVVTDLLNKVPSVSVSPTGAISLRGNSNVLVLIDGRRTGLTQGNALEQVPADQVERVEVITNPSSRYDAGGSAGIINIILKKNKKSGFSGQMRVVGGIPNETRLSPSLNYKSEKLNLFATYGLRLSDYVGLYTMQQSTALLSSPRYLDQRQDENRHDDARLLYFGVDYKINSKNTVTAAFLRNATNDHDKTRLYYLYSDQNRSADSSLTRNGESWEKRSYNQLEFNYTRGFEQTGKKLTVDMQYDFWDSDKDWILETSRLFPNAATLAQIRTGSAGASKDLMIKTDMTQVLDSIFTLEYGLKSETRRVSSDFIAQQQNGAGWDIIDGIDNHLLYKEMISSAYLQFSGKLSQFSYQAGLRGEMTHIGIEDRIGHYSNDKDYTRLFPSLNIGYNLKSSTSLQLSYSKRITRPSLNMIYPFNELTDLSSRYLGNPDLNPSFADVYELGLLNNWQALTLNLSVYHQNNRGVIEDYTYRDLNGLFITMPVNIGGDRRTGLELSLLFNPLKWLQMNSELNLFHYAQKGIYGSQNFDYSSHTLTGRFNAQIRLKNKLAFQTLYNFRGANATAQSRYAAVHQIDFGTSKTLLKEKATLSFDVSNLFALRKSVSNTTGSDYLIDQQSIPNAARYRLTLIYRLNLKDNQSIRQAKSGNRN